MNRFFVQKSCISSEKAEITGDDVKHITKVLRLTAGDRIVLCDAEGTDYTAAISALSKDRVECDILGNEPSRGEPARRVTLYQGLPKASKLELVIQKCVELGIYAIAPVAADRSVVRLSAGEFEERRLRYQRISLEAAKQAGRGMVPCILPLTTYYKADLSRHDLIIVAYEEERERSLKSLIRGSSARDIALVIGPEGGLEQNEVDSLVNRGGSRVTFGSRILRTETAGMAALAMILYELEG